MARACLSRRSNVAWLAAAMIALPIAITIRADSDAPPEILLLPREIVLRGAGAQHQLIVEAAANGTLVADLTPDSTFTTSNPVVATVDARGIVTAVGDGRAIVTATHRSRSASVVVRVEGAFAPYPVSFRNHVLPVLTKAGCNSGPCHGAAAGKNGFKLTLRGYDPELDYLVLTRQAAARRVNRLEPAHSLMLLKPTLAVSHGGGRRFRVDSQEYRILSEWIAAGAPAPDESDPALVALEVLPEQVRLAPGDRQQMIVRAHFSDGHIEDVTRWAKYSSTDEGIASVTDRGVATMEGPGEAAISVWYMSRVKVARVFAPFEHTVDASVFSAAPRHNRIDELTLAKLQELQIPPSGPASDSAFIRRAYLDAAGTLPTPDEVRRFLEDPSPEKRSRLVDALLERDEFVDYWAYKWSDLLLVSTRELAPNAMWAYYNWLRARVAENAPWDRMVRELLTASGSTLANGAANYYVLHKNPIDITENISVAFMGFSITCARCHNHPLEKWTQKDYYQMANLFSRVALKNGNGRGDVIVYTAPSGEINHPRTNVPLPPRPLEARPLPLDSGADRREYFVEWLTSPENPYFARALVNRVWKGFFGRGIVEPVDDIRETNPAANGELIDYLARDFVEHGFDVKHLIRQIMNSATYQRSSRPLDANKDDLKYHSHYVARRLPAEVILDAVSQVTGVPEGFPGQPKGRRALQLPDTSIDSYFLDTFGRPPRLVALESERQQEPSVTQALHAINGGTINAKLQSPDGIVQKLLDERADDRKAIETLYLRALSRLPTEDETRELTAAMARSYTEALERTRAMAVTSFDPPDGDGRPANGHGQGVRAASEAPSVVAPERRARRQVLEDLAWAILTSKEFLFNH